MADTITTTGTVGSYSNYCANRLPCGVCRIMMCQCPVFNGCGITQVPIKKNGYLDIKTMKKHGRHSNNIALIVDSNLVNEMAKK